MLSAIFHEKCLWYYQIMLKRILKVPGQSFFLLDPRGSGKSTWLRSTFSDAHVIDPLSEEAYQRLLSNPGQFADELRPISAGRWCFMSIREDMCLPGYWSNGEMDMIFYQYSRPPILRVSACGAGRSLLFNFQPPIIALS